MSYKVLASLVGGITTLVISAGIALAQPPPPCPPNLLPQQMQNLRLDIRGFQIEPNRLRWWQERGFFDPGPAPFEGRAPLRGVPLDSYHRGPDTAIRRLEIDFTLPISTETVQLKFRGVEPVIIEPPGKQPSGPAKSSPEPKEQDNPTILKPDRLDSDQEIMDGMELEIQELLKWLR